MVENIEQAVRASGFEPSIDRVETEDEIRTFAERQHHFQEYDLILLDLRLGNGIRGDELAPNVRAHFPSTPILFYSAEDEKELRKRMAANLVEGVYCIHRDRLASRVKEIVSHLAPAINRLSSMRGLAARVVAECDQDFRAILRYWAALSPQDDAEITASLKERVRLVSEKAIVDLDSYNSVEELFSGHAVHSAALFCEARDGARARGGDPVRDVVRSLRKTYQSELLARRNTLAHALEERTDDGWRITRPNAAPLTVNDFERYRRDFLTQLHNVRRLRELLIAS